MEKEQEKTIAALRTAIQMEVDGKDFYLKAAASSSNTLGKQLLNQLAVEEDVHRRVFENIYNSLARKEGWPEVTIEPNTRLKTILSDAKNQIAPDKKPLKEEIDAVQTAMELENKTFDFYRSRANEVSSASEKEFFLALSAQEEEHHRVLLDYFEYLKDPESWFVKIEHPSLDGG